MHHPLRPINELGIDLLQGLRVVSAKLHPLPPLARQVLAFGLFDVQIQPAILGVRPDGGIARLCEGAGLAVAEAGDVVLVAAEGGVLCGFELEGAELLREEVPDDLGGVGHFEGRGEGKMWLVW